MTRKFEGRGKRGSASVFVPGPRNRTFYCKYAVPKSPEHPTGRVIVNTGIPVTGQDSLTPGGWKKFSRTSREYKAALKFAEEREREFWAGQKIGDSGQPVMPQAVPSRRTFSKWIEARIEDRRSKIAHGSLGGIKSHLRHALAFFGDVKMEKVAERLSAYQTTLGDAGLSTSTIDSRIFEVEAVLGISKTQFERLPGWNPPVDPESVAPEPEIPYFSAPDLDALFAEVRKTLPGLADLAEARSICGVRTAALALVKWSWITADRLTVPKALMKDRKQRLHDYILPLVGDLARIFTRSANTSGDLVFTNAQGEPLMREKYLILTEESRGVWNAAVKKILGARFEFADLRHVAEQRMVEAKVDPEIRHLIMAHNTNTIQQRYQNAAVHAASGLREIQERINLERQAERKIAVLKHG